MLLVLASASPRRKELLTQAGFSFHVLPANIAEDRRPGEAPDAFVTRLAGEKAQSVFDRIRSTPEVIPEGSGRSLAVLAADTIVVVDGDVLGKPRDAAHAAGMLRRLSGRTHQVITGVCLMIEGKPEIVSETTSVTMAEISDGEIAAYVAGGEPMDKAGAYAIQGRAACWVPHIEGCYFNVVGLPLARVAGMLRAAKIQAAE